MWIAALLLGLTQSDAAAPAWTDERAEARTLEAPEANGAALEAWRDRLRPTEDERRWDEVPWVSSFAEGLRRADERGRPLLLWAMNGHPLGCT